MNDLRSFFALVISILCLASCSLLPSASDKFQAPQGITAAQVFDCADKKISSRKKDLYLWDGRTTLPNIPRGVYETDNFQSYSAMGFFTQIIFDSKKSSGEIRIRATGPYFVDLGAKRELLALKQEIISCLENETSRSEQ